MATFTIPIITTTLTSLTTVNSVSTVLSSVISTASSLITTTTTVTVETESPLAQAKIVLITLGATITVAGAYIYYQYRTVKKIRGEKIQLNREIQVHRSDVARYQTKIGKYEPILQQVYGNQLAVDTLRLGPNPLLGV